MGYITSSFYWAIIIEVIVLINAYLRMTGLGSCFLILACYFFYQSIWYFQGFSIVRWKKKLIYKLKKKNLKFWHLFTNKYTILLLSRAQRETYSQMQFISVSWYSYPVTLIPHVHNSRKRWAGPGRARFFVTYLLPNG